VVTKFLKRYDKPELCPEHIQCVWTVCSCQLTTCQLLNNL